MRLHHRTATSIMFLFYPLKSLQSTQIIVRRCVSSVHAGYRCSDEENLGTLLWSWEFEKIPGIAGCDALSSQPLSYIPSLPPIPPPALSQVFGSDRRPARLRLTQRASHYYRYTTR